MPLNEAAIGDFVVGVERSGLPMTNVSKTVTEANLSEVNSQIKAGKLRVALPIVVAKAKLFGGIMGEIEAEILEKEGVTGDLRFNEFSRVACKGSLRAAVTPLKDFGVQSVSGQQDASSATLRFMLLRGSYATVVLRELMKPKGLVAAGF